MSKLILIILLLLIVGCKKDKAAIVKPAMKVYKNEMKGQAIDSTSLLAFKDSTLYLFYKMHGFETVWSNPKIRADAIEILSLSVDEGLEPEDYNLPILIRTERKIDSLTVKELINYDVQLSIALQKYLEELSNGKLNPKSLYGNWDLKRKRVNINVLISDGIMGDSLREVFNNALPSDYMYKRLKYALKLINKFPKDNLAPIYTADRKIIRNDSSRTVLEIKKRLVYWGDLKKGDSLTELYDAETFKAVKRFQARHGLSADGVIGKGTVSALNFTKTQRKRQIIANLERWRWFPRQLGDHYIIVNISGYLLTVVKDKDTIEEKRVVVGKMERKTPVLSSVFTSITINPTWTVPPTILREDLLPSATKNRNYFVEKEITIYDWKNNTVSPEAWNPEKFKSYRYVQSPGDHNALGNIKFNFPNRYTVYLHDTNHRDYFSKNFRSLSSGCVRVEDPLPLAAYLIGDAKRWPLDSIYSVIGTKETVTIRLREKIMIHQLYWTAWSEKNNLVFRDDIYHLDAALYEALRK